MLELPVELRVSQRQWRFKQLQVQPGVLWTSRGRLRRVSGEHVHVRAGQRGVLGVPGELSLSQQEHSREQLPVPPGVLGTKRRRVLSVRCRHLQKDKRFPRLLVLRGALQRHHRGGSGRHIVLRCSAAGGTAASRILCCSSRGPGGAAVGRDYDVRCAAAAQLTSACRSST